MQKIISLFLLFTAITVTCRAQKYIARNGHIWFYSEAPVENIEAHNYQVSSILEIGSGKLVFSLPVKGFQFEKALMQEHFNEKFMHSDEYPKSKFKGKITNINELNLKQEGEYQAKVKGELTIHGVTKTKQTDGTFTVKGDTILGQSLFRVAVKNYDITIPKVVQDNIADTVDVHVDIKYRKYN
jgi:hypothetical protein